MIQNCYCSTYTVSPVRGSLYLWYIRCIARRRGVNYVISPFFIYLFFLCIFLQVSSFLLFLCFSLFFFIFPFYSVIIFSLFKFDFHFFFLSLLSFMSLLLLSNYFFFLYYKTVRFFLIFFHRNFINAESLNVIMTCFIARCQLGTYHILLLFVLIFSFMLLLVILFQIPVTVAIIYSQFFCYILSFSIMLCLSLLEHFIFL